MTYDTMTYAERVTAERTTARAILRGLQLWQRFCYADCGTLLEVEAREAWIRWLDAECGGGIRHPLANRVREMHDQLGGIAQLHNAGELA